MSTSHTSTTQFDNAPLKAEFTIINWQESTQIEINDSEKMTLANIKQSYQGHIVGESSTQYVMHYQDAGTAYFVGFELIKADIEGQACQLTLKHDGQFINGVASSRFVVVSSTPHKKWIGRSGQFSSTENGVSSFELNYTQTT